MAEKLYMGMTIVMVSGCFIALAGAVIYVITSTLKEIINKQASWKDWLLFLSMLFMSTYVFLAIYVAVTTLKK